MKPLFIDIGAMDGREVKWALDQGYEVHAFEPNPKCKKDLQQYEERALIHYAAAWNEDGTAKLHLMFNPEPGEDGVSLIKEKANVSPDRFIEVPTVNIGKYLYELGRDVEVLKINAEGAEYVILESVLDNFDISKIKKLFVEDHRNYITDKDWLEHKEKVLKRLGKIQLIDWGDQSASYKLLGSSV